MNLNFIVTSEVLKEAILPAGKSFNILMVIAQDAAKAGKYETYTSAEEAEDAGITGDLLKGIQIIFSQELRPNFIKVGYVSDYTSTADLTTLSTATDWYFTVYPEKTLTETTIKDVALWYSSNKKIAVITDLDEGAKDQSSGLTKALFDAKADHFFAIYADENDEDGNPTDDYKFISYALIASMAAISFDNPNSFYAVPHLIKNYVGVKPVHLTPTEREKLTGYTINVGYDLSKGLLGNFLGDYEGYTFLYSGLMPNGVPISEVVALDYLNRRIQEDTATYFKQNKFTGYDDKSIAGILLTFRRSLLRGVRAGFLLPDQIAIENINSLKERITDVMRSNGLFPKIQAQIKCNKPITHLAYSSQCMPYHAELGV